MSTRAGNTVAIITGASAGIGEADDVGKVIAALLGDDCAWVTGEKLEASGGFN